MKIYNTLTREKEQFKPLVGNEVRIYSCGPTVYDYAHIGNLRTYVFMDLLRKVLRHNGYKLKGVMNITDVGHLVSDSDEGEDKMVKKAKATSKTPEEIAKYYTDVFFDDIKKLNIENPEIIAKATDNIKEMIDFVAQLQKDGYAYETSDGVYFDISRFEDYGKLSKLDLEGQIAGARVEVNEEKRNPIDFALWKKAPKEHIMQWESPWGMGYPGWHIECSAMARKYLGDTFDIHTGGVDHIPVHHENEIAQSESLTGEPSARYWVHSEFLQVNNGKMSKSLGNTYTIANIVEKGYSPLAYRYMCLNANYRNKLNFTWDGLKAAQTSLNRIYEGVLSHKGAKGVVEKDVIDKFKKDFNNAINDDLNIPLALGITWNAVRYPSKSNDLYELLLEMDEIFSLNFATAKGSNVLKELENVPQEVSELIGKRQEARKDKNFALADEIRDEIFKKGYVIKDTKDGVAVEKCS